MRLSNTGSVAHALTALNRNSRALDRSSNRLSSGIRLSSSRHGSAAVAVSTGLRAEVVGLDLVRQNSSNGISITQVADASLGQIQDMLQRVRELTVLASNGTLTVDDKTVVQLEIDMLIEEIDETARNAQYNGINLLTGNASRMATSLDRNSSVLRVSESMNSGQYSFTILEQATRTTHLLNMPALPDNNLSGTITLNGIPITLVGGETEDEFNALIRDAASLAGFSFDQETGTIASNSYGSRHALTFGGDEALLLALGLTPDNTTLGTDIVLDIGGTNPADLLSPGATTRSDGNRVTLTDANGREMIFDVRTGLPVGQELEINIGESPLVIQTGTRQHMELQITIPMINTQSLNIDNINVVTFDTAQLAITKTNDAISSISHARARVGGYENRLEFVVDSIEIASIATQEALSRIVDTDMAAEMARFSIQQTLIQSSISMISQLNQKPQMLLQLLQ
jgi:flagellin